MTKTKRQLRAEAVENLKANSDWAWHDLADFFKASGLMDSPYNTPYRELRAALIDLLEDDDMDSAVYVQKCPNDELPEGNAVVALRKWVSNHDPQLRGHGLSMLETLADMIERDYIRRDDYDFTVEMLNCMKAERDKLKKQMDILRNAIREGRKERDEWRAKAEQAQESYLDAKSDRDAWHARYTTLQEGQSKARAGQSNLEWLYMHDSELAGYVDGCVFNKGYVSIDTLQWAHEWLMAPHDEANDALAPENDVRADCAPLIDHDLNAKVLDVLKNAPGWAKEEISDNLRKSQDSEIESCRQDADQPKREEVPDCESDSREKLEADIEKRAVHAETILGPLRIGTVKVGTNVIHGWLDRQAAIDERYWKSQVDALVSKGEMIADGNTWLWSEAAELQEKVDEQRKSLEATWEDNAELITQVDALTQANGDLRDEWYRVCRERDELQRKLHESNRERERLRKSLGIAIDHAHDMIALVSVDTDEGLA